MCLDFRYDRKTEKAMIAKLPKTKTVYKKVLTRANQYSRKYYSPCRGGVYTTGVNVSSASEKHVWFKRLNYPAGFHSFLSVENARNWWGTDGTTIKCKVKKEDVVTIGRQNGREVIVSKKITMPDPKDKSAVVA